MDSKSGAFWIRHPNTGPLDTEAKNPCRGTDPGTGLGPEVTFGGQSTFVFQIPGQDRYYAMFDLWNPDNLAGSRYLWCQIHWQDDEYIIAPGLFPD